MPYTDHDPTYPHCSPPVSVPPIVLVHSMSACLTSTRPYYRRAWLTAANTAWDALAPETRELIVRDMTELRARLADLGAAPDVLADLDEFLEVRR